MTTLRDSIMAQWQQRHDTVAAHHDALARYQRLRDVYHIDLDDQLEAQMDYTQKIEYVQVMVELIDQIGEEYKQVALAQQEFQTRSAELRTLLKQPAIRQLISDMRQTLVRLSSLQIEEHYTLRDYLHQLSQRQAPVSRPRQFFAAELADIRAARTELQDLNQDITQALTDTRAYLAAQQREAHYRAQRDRLRQGTQQSPFSTTWQGPVRQRRNGWDELFAEMMRHKATQRRRVRRGMPWPQGGRADVGSVVDALDLGGMLVKGLSGAARRGGGSIFGSAGAWSGGSSVMGSLGDSLGSLSDGLSGLGDW